MQTLGLILAHCFKYRLNTLLKYCCSFAKLCPTLCNPMDDNLPRFLCPWNFPGKNTRVGCHFLLQKYWSTRGVPNLWNSLCIFFLSATLPCEIWPPCCNHMDYRIHMEFSRPEYWSGYLFLLQGIFPTQGSNPGILHWEQIHHQLSHKGSPWPFRISNSVSSTQGDCQALYVTLSLDAT